MRHKGPEDGVCEPGAHAENPRDEDQSGGGAEAHGDHAHAVGEQTQQADEHIGKLEESSKKGFNFTWSYIICRIWFSMAQHEFCKHILSKSMS